MRRDIPGELHLKNGHKMPSAPSMSYPPPNLPNYCIWRAQAVLGMNACASQGDHDEHVKFESRQKCQETKISPKSENPIWSSYLAAKHQARLFYDSDGGTYDATHGVWKT